MALKYRQRIILLLVLALLQTTFCSARGRGGGGYSRSSKTSVGTGSSIVKVKPDIRWIGTAWIISELDGESYLGDVSLCVGGCTINSQCGTQKECGKKPFTPTKKLLITLGTLLSLCGLCILMTKLDNCCNPKKDKLSDSKSYLRKNSYSNSAVGFRDDNFLRANGLDAISEN